MDPLRRMVSKMEAASSCCALESEAPCTLDDHFLDDARDGLRVLVVRAGEAESRSKKLGVALVSNFATAASVCKGRHRALVVADKALKYFSEFVRGPISLMVFDSADFLACPSCPDFKASVVWIVTLVSRKMMNRGYLRDCMEIAAMNDAILAHRVPRETSAGRARETLFYNRATIRSADLARRALALGRCDVAVNIFPGPIMRRFYPDACAAEEGMSERVCPICLESPPGGGMRPQVISRCCRREFCMACVAEWHDDSSGVEGRRMCTWCRAPAMFEDYSLIVPPSSTSVSPPKEIAVEQTVQALLESDPGSQVLVVTTDDVYLMKEGEINPLARFAPAILYGVAPKVMERRMARSRGVSKVVVVHATRSVGLDITHGAKNVVFTEQAACEGKLERLWCLTANSPPSVHKIKCPVTEAVSLVRGRVDDN